MDKSTKSITFTDCLLHLVASCIDKKAEEVLIFMDINKGFLYIICGGIETNCFILANTTDMNFLGRRYFLNNVKHSYEFTLASLINLSEKVEILTTNNNNQAYKMVYNYGVMSSIAEVIPKVSTCTEIVVKGLLFNAPHGGSKMGIYEYFVLRGHLSAMALITCSIPIKISDRIFGDIINWPGKFTGLGSAFLAVIKPNDSTVLPAFANFKNVSMKAFIGLRLYSNKYLQYIYINKNFVMWKPIYKIFNYIIGKSYTKNDKHFTFVLNIECPDSECVTIHRNYTTEIRPINIRDIVTCFCFLQDNIKMIMNCVKKDPCMQQSLALWPNKFDKMYSFTVNYQDLMNPFEIQNIVLKLKSIMQDQHIRNSLLQLNDKLYKSNLHMCINEGSNISVLSIIYKMISSSQNSCNNSHEMTIILRYLVNTIFSIDLEDVIASMEYLCIAKTNELKNPIDEIHFEETVSKISQTECELLTYSTTGRHNIDTQYDANNKLPNLNVNDFILNKPHISKSYLGLKDQGNFAALPYLTISNNDPGDLDKKEIEKVNLYQQFNVASRNMYIPKGASPIMAKRDKISLICERTTIQSSNQMFDIIDANICNGADLNLVKQSKVSSLCTDVQFISKELFEHMNVIGQLDKKYILCNFNLISQQEEIEKILVIFDQHGIDERVRLENLLIRFVDDPEKGNLVRQVMQEYWIVLNCSNKKLKILFQFSDYFLKYGFEFKAFSTNTLTVTSIPEMLHWLAEYWTINSRFYLEFLYTTLENVIEEQLESITKTGHTTNVLPSIIHKYLCKTACSSAVKFGMSLTLSECKAVVNELSKCKIPFMCAHGRPTAFFITKISANFIKMPPTLGLLKQS